MSVSICSIAGCGVKSKARGWCNKHWYRWYRNGDPEKRLHLRGDGLEARLWFRVTKSSACWEWGGTVDSSGYGAITHENRTLSVHRLAYELQVGAIPDGLVIDHLCHNRVCVRPEHLRPVTRKQNTENHSGISKVNTSGYRGVSWYKGREQWTSSVTHQGKQIRIGYYPLYELHVAGYKAMMKRNELFTHNDKDRIS